MKVEDVKIGETYWTDEGPAVARAKSDTWVAVQGDGWTGNLPPCRLRPLDEALEAAKRRHAQRCAETKAACEQAARRTEKQAMHAHDPARDMDAAFDGTPKTNAPHYVEMDVSDWLGTQPTDEVAQDAPHYGGWSEGDVLAYLSRFGGCGNNGGEFFCRKGCFIAWFRYGEDGDTWRIDVSVDPQVKGFQGLEDTLPEAMQWAVERWRELVAESDPMPTTNEQPQTRQPATTAYGMTGDLGTRSEFGAGWHDPEEK